MTLKDVLDTDYETVIKEYLSKYERQYNYYVLLDENDKIYGLVLGCYIPDDPGADVLVHYIKPYDIKSEYYSFRASIETFENKWIVKMDTNN